MQKLSKAFIAMLMILSLPAMAKDYIMPGGSIKSNSLGAYTTPKGTFINDGSGNYIDGFGNKVYKDGMGGFKYNDVQIKSNSNNGFNTENTTILQGYDQQLLEPKHGSHIVVNENNADNQKQEATNNKSDDIIKLDDNTEPKNDFLKYDQFKDQKVVDLNEIITDYDQLLAP